MALAIIFLNGIPGSTGSKYSTDGDVTRARSYTTVVDLTGQQCARTRMLYDFISLSSVPFYGLPIISEKIDGEYAAVTAFKRCNLSKAA